MRNQFYIFILTAMLASACTDRINIPIMGDYTIYEVDIKELSGLCLNKEHTSLIACGDKGVIKSVSFTGQAEELWTYPSDMEGVTINPSDGNIYIAIEGEQEVHLLSAPEYEEQTTLFAVNDAASYGNSGLEAVEYYKDDILLVGSQKGATLWQYGMDGTLISTISLSSFASEIAGLCYDPEADMLWVTDSKKAQVFICTVNGELLATYDFSFIENAESICVDRARDCVWIGSDEDNTKLYRIDFNF